MMRSKIRCVGGSSFSSKCSETLADTVLFSTVNRIPKICCLVLGIPACDRARCSAGTGFKGENLFSEIEKLFCRTQRLPCLCWLASNFFKKICSSRPYNFFCERGAERPGTQMRALWNINASHLLRRHGEPVRKIWNHLFPRQNEELFYLVGRLKTACTCFRARWRLGNFPGEIVK